MDKVFIEDFTSNPTRILKRARDGDVGLVDNGEISAIISVPQDKRSNWDGVSPDSKFEPHYKYRVALTIDGETAFLTKQRSLPSIEDNVETITIYAPCVPQAVQKVMLWIRDTDEAIENRKPRPKRKIGLIKLDPVGTVVDSLEVDCYICKHAYNYGELYGEEDIVLTIRWWYDDGSPRCPMCAHVYDDCLC
jgi:hypothetical protein